MSFEVLERDVGVEHRIAIIEPADESNRHEAIGHRVDEAAAELLHAQRIAHRMDHGPGRDAVLRHFPQLFDAERVLLRGTAIVEGETANQRFGQVAADAVAENRDARPDIDTRLERRLDLAVASDTAIAGPHAGDAVAVVQELRRGKAGEEIDAFRFDQAAQPLDEAAQRNDVVAVIGERRRCDRKTEFAAAGEEVHVVVVHFSG